MPNMNLLKSKMIASGDKNFVQCLANILNCSRTTASGKLNERIDFSQSDIILLTKKYHLTADDVKNIFIGTTEQDEIKIDESFPNIERYMQDHGFIPADRYKVREYIRYMIRNTTRRIVKITLTRSFLIAEDENGFKDMVSREVLGLQVY